MLVAVIVGGCIASQAAAVEFHPTIEAARDAEAAETAEARKPVVITFGADWCGWCRKLELDTFGSDEVAALADRFLWVKTDVDEHEDLAARFRVRGLPHTFVLNGEDRIIATRPGYLPADEFVAFLEDALANPQPVEDVLADLLLALESAEEDAVRSTAVTALVEYLAQAERGDRTLALAELAAADGGLLPPLAALLKDERLSVRAAAFGVLTALTRQELEFDPFAPADERGTQAAAWIAWTAEHSATPVQP
jgi:thioredoxin-like negative regulator of GroEL